jgi:hypothetical protein
MASVVRFAMAVVLATITGGTAAQTPSPLRLHESIAAPQRPLLCADRDSINLIAPVLARAADARAARDADKSKRLTEIATRLQGEVCRKPAAEDVVILRCKLAQIDAGGAALALVKVTAIIQTEAAKGEQAFYGWTDLRVEDVASGPAAQEANTRWCSNERADRATRQIRIEERDNPAAPVALVTPPAQNNAESNEPFTASPDIVLRVQQRLYDFGLRMENLDGNLSQETVRNLVQFQKFASLPADGQLTRATIARLMTIPAPGPWVTIAFDGFGNFAAENGRTRRETEIVALERLQRRSGREPKVSSVAAPGCIGLAVTRYAERGRRSRTNFTQAFTSAGDTLESAAQNAFDFCERDKGGGQCQVRYALCADGRGVNPQADDRDRDRRRGRDRGDEARRFDRETVPVNAPGPRFDPNAMPANAPMPGPRFDPNSLSINSQAPQERPSIPTMRSDPNIPAVNAPRR